MTGIIARGLDLIEDWHSKQVAGAATEWEPEVPTKVPSEPLGAIEPVSGTTSYAGVTQLAGVAGEAVRLEAVFIVSRLRATIAERDATIERRTNVAVRLEGIIAEQEAEIGRLKDTCCAHGDSCNLHSAAEPTPDKVCWQIGDLQEALDRRSQ